jgi:hypothetical protein
MQNEFLSFLSLFFLDWCTVLICFYLFACMYLCCYCLNMLSRWGAIQELPRARIWRIWRDWAAARDWGRQLYSLIIFFPNNLYSFFLLHALTWWVPTSSILMIHVLEARLFLLKEWVVCLVVELWLRVVYGNNIDTCFTPFGTTEVNWCLMSNLKPWSDHPGK